MAQTIKPFSVTHEMMVAYQDTFRLDLAQATELLHEMVAEIRNGIEGPQPLDIALEEIAVDPTDTNTLLRLLNHGPDIAFPYRKVLEKVTL